MKTSPLKVERVKQGKTQAEVAKAARVPEYKYSFFEQGVMKLSPEEIDRIGKVLKINLGNPF
jgi:transcriptional regulator with XRE-family HTH domain